MARRPAPACPRAGPAIPRPASARGTTIWQARRRLAGTARPGRKIPGRTVPTRVPHESPHEHNSVAASLSGRQIHRSQAARIPGRLSPLESGGARPAARVSATRRLAARQRYQMRCARGPAPVRGARRPSCGSPCCPRRWQTRWFVAIAGGPRARCLGGAGDGARACCGGAAPCMLNQSSPTPGSASCRGDARLWCRPPRRYS